MQNQQTAINSGAIGRRRLTTHRNSLQPYIPNVIAQPISPEGSVVSRISAASVVQIMKKMAVGSFSFLKKVLFTRNHGEEEEQVFEIPASPVHGQVDLDEGSPVSFQRSWGRLSVGQKKRQPDETMETIRPREASVRRRISVVSQDSGNVGKLIDFIRQESKTSASQTAQDILDKLTNLVQAEQLLPLTPNRGTDGLTLPLKQPPNLLPPRPLRRSSVSILTPQPQPGAKTIAELLGRTSLVAKPASPPVNDNMATIMKALESAKTAKSEPPKQVVDLCDSPKKAKQASAPPAVPVPAPQPAPQPQPAAVPAALPAAVPTKFIWGDASKVSDKDFVDNDGCFAPNADESSGSEGSGGEDEAVAKTTKTKAMTEPVSFGSIFSAPASSAAAASIFGTSQPSGATATSIFGQPSPAPPANSIFGAPASGTIFGAPASSAPASGTIFGAPASSAPAPAPASVFGALASSASVFEAPASSAPASASVFGAPSSTAPAPASIFGAPASSAPASASIFGAPASSAPASASVFGAPASSTPASIFGATAAVQSSVGSATAGGASIFGSPFGQTTAETGSLFGGAATAGASMFGAPASTPFGGAQPTAVSPFGAQPSPFGSQPSPFGAQASQAADQTTVFGSQPSPFGATSGIFGQTQPSPFGQPAAQSSNVFAFGTTEGQNPFTTGTSSVEGRRILKGKRSRPQ